MTSIALRTRGRVKRRNSVLIILFFSGPKVSYGGFCAQDVVAFALWEVAEAALSQKKFAGVALLAAAFYLSSTFFLFGFPRESLNTTTSTPWPSGSR
jgi:hypothetical protein